MIYELNLKDKFFNQISKREKLVEYRSLTFDRAQEWSRMLSWFLWLSKSSVIDREEIFQIVFRNEDASKSCYRTVYKIEICGFDDLPEKVQADLLFCGFDVDVIRKLPWIKLFLEDF